MRGESLFAYPERRCPQNSGAARDRWARELVQSIVDRTSPVLLDHAEAALALGLTSAALDYRLREGTVALDDAVCVGTRQLYRSAQLRPLLLVG